jgi:hypothetical protein
MRSTRAVLHSDFVTTQGYIDAAVLNALRKQRDRLFPPLPRELVEAARGGVSPERTRRARAEAGQGRAPNGAAQTPTGLLSDPNGN